MELEEAIEYLEQFIGIQKEYKYNPIKVKTLNNTRQAIENLIKYIKEESIPRAVVKEEIKKLDKTYKEMKETSDFIIADTIQPKIEILQEILNKGE